MKRISIILSLLVVLSIPYSCESPDVPEAGFKDQLKFTIYDYLVENENDYSSFLQILQAGGLDKTLSAYNPGGKTAGDGYTLFLPDNKAVDDFISSSNGEYANLEALLNDKAFSEALAKYHILNQGVASNEFPFGTFNQPTLSNDFLNVNFDVQSDTTFYKINNQAQVIKANIELSNGYIQVIGAMLKPITLNSYGWLKKNSGYSIFTAALEATGIDKTINVDMRIEDQLLKPFTMLVEPDAVYKKRNINSVEDLMQTISPGRTDYTNSTNPLNVFVGYHLVTGSSFLDDLAKYNTNYSTFADIPVRINGLGLDIVINKSPELVFIDENQDTTDFVGLDYDVSNVNTQSGPIHFITQILKPWVPARADQNFGLWDEPLLQRYGALGGNFSIETQSELDNITWSGEELVYVKSIDASDNAWNNDYLLIEGDFSLTYNIAKIIQGKYDVFIQADGFNSRNAVVEVYIDGNKLGGLIDLTKDGSANDPFHFYKVGTIDFKKYEGHAVQIKTLIPGILKLDVIQFKPI